MVDFRHAYGMSRTRKHSPVEGTAHNSKEQMERLIRAVEMVSGQIEVLRNALDDILVEVQWHIRNYEQRLRSILETAARTIQPAEPPHLDEDSRCPREQTEVPTTASINRPPEPASAGPELPRQAGLFDS
jgi:hypothetical protein